MPYAEAKGKRGKITVEPEDWDEAGVVGFKGFSSPKTLLEVLKPYLGSQNLLFSGLVPVVIGP